MIRAMNRPFRAGDMGGVLTQPFGLGCVNQAFSPNSKPASTVTAFG